MSERPAEPRVIDPDDAEDIRRAADEMRVREDLVKQAIREVGPNRTAVELWLTAPRP